MKRSLSRFLLLACSAALPAIALAADYPTKPVKIVVTYPPGGGMDVEGRMISVPLAKRLGQPVVIENKPGASGMIGAEYVARSAPDGYTLILAPADTHSINPHVYSNMRYDAIKDFEPVGVIASLPMSLVVNPAMNAKTVAEFKRLVAQNPGKMSFASWGIGSSSHVAMAALLLDGNLQMLHVPFAGAAPAITAVIAGQVDAAMVTLPTSEPQASKVRIIAVTPTRRPAGAPTYPSEGMPSDSELWTGLLAPAKTPQDVVERVNKELAAVMQEAELRASLEKIGFEPAAKVGSAAEFRKYVTQQYDAWGKTIRAAKISAELK